MARGQLGIEARFSRNHNREHVSGPKRCGSFSSSGQLARCSADIPRTKRTLHATVLRFLVHYCRYPAHRPSATRTVSNRLDEQFTTDNLNVKCQPQPAASSQQPAVKCACSDTCCAIVASTSHLLPTGARDKYASLAGCFAGARWPAKPTELLAVGSTNLADSRLCRQLFGANSTVWLAPKNRTRSP